jgi:hypothetical protein
MVHRILRSRWLPYAVAVLWLALGFANLARGAAHPGVPYRPWAFDHHAYSDLLALAGDRYFHGGRPIPYLQDQIEYPPLLGLALWLPALVSQDPLGYFTVGYLALAACGLAAVALAGRIGGADRWWIAGSPALAYYAGLNWDLLPIALFLAAVLASERGRPAAAGALAALGASAKLWPIVLVPVLAAALVRGRDLRSLRRVGLAFAAVALTVNLPLVLATPDRWSWFWRFNAARGAENSIWEVLRLSPATEQLAFDATFLNAAGALLLGAAALLAASCAWRAAGTPGRAGRAGRAVALGVAFVIVVWIATNKVWSPQYALWACAAGALAAAPWRLLVLHGVVAAVDYHVAFETRASRGLIRYFGFVYTAEEVARFAAYVALAAWIGRELWRAANPTPTASPTSTPTASGFA